MKGQRTRPATADDHAAFVRLFAELGLVDPTPDRERWSREIAPDALVLEEDGAVHAYVFAEPYPPVGYVRHLVVDPCARRRGLGRRALCEAARRLASLGCTRWRLNVARTNERAIGLYRSLGMEVVTTSFVVWFPWSALETLRTGAAADERADADRAAVARANIVAVDAREDASIEHAFALPPGQIARLRSLAGARLVAVRDGDDELASWLGFARFDAGFPGAFPFRVRGVPVACRLLNELSRASLPESTGLQLVIEDGEPIARTLLAAGAELRLEIVQMEGALPE